MSERTLRRHAHAARYVLVKTRTEIAGASFYLLIRGRRVIVVARDTAQIARRLRAVPAAQRNHTRRTSDMSKRAALLKQETSAGFAATHWLRRSSPVSGRLSAARG
jgi:hypothetical protein